MPSIELNRSLWGGDYDWAEDGDEWSRPWGDADAQWYGCIFPRIHSFLPSASVLEIAPGFGRWTQYLKDQCEHLTIVDLNANCIDKCRERFEHASNIHYFVNDGSSLSMVPENSVDFVFSFDSLVHVELPVLEVYLSQLAGKLKRNGVGFFHHSNIGEYASRWRLTGRLPKTVKHYLTRARVLNYYHLRAFSVTAANFEEACHRHGLVCISQELVNWRQRLLIDAFSIFTRTDSDFARPNRVMRNHYFMREADQIARGSRLYSFDHLARTTIKLHLVKQPGVELRSEPSK